MSFQTLDQLTSVESQMSLKFAATTAKIVGDAVKINMKANINGNIQTLVTAVNLAYNLHFNEYADSLNTEDESYPDDVDLMNSAMDQVTQNLIELGLM